MSLFVLRRSHLITTLICTLVALVESFTAMNKVVVVTGASSGIGAALGKLLASKGAKVVLAARNVEGLNAVAAQCNPDNVLVHRCDVTKREDHEALLQAAITRFGRVTCWVNNAGLGISRNVLDLSDEDVDTILAVNLKSVLYGMQVSVKHFKEHGNGQVINVSSLLGRTPAAPPRSIYSAAKAAVNSLTANARMEVYAAGFPNIHVSLFSPGVVATPFGLNAIDGHIDSFKIPGAQDVDEVAALIDDMVESPGISVDVYSRPAYKTNVINYLSAEDIRTVEASFVPQTNPGRN